MIALSVSVSVCQPPLPPSLSPQLDASMVENLDSALNEGKEIGAMYQEINKTLSTRHLQFESVGLQAAMT